MHIAHRTVVVKLIFDNDNKYLYYIKWYNNAVLYLILFKIQKLRRKINEICSFSMKLTNNAKYSF